MKYSAFGFPVNPQTNKDLFRKLALDCEISEYKFTCLLMGCIYSCCIDGEFYVYPTHVYLDDERRPPRNWFIVDNVHDMIDLLLYCPHVKVISLDHDLGLEEETGNGYDVLLFLEQAIFDGRVERLPEIFLHTANISAKQKMELAITAIKKRFNERTAHDH